MKFTPRAVPWSCPEEWDYVRQLLYSSDSNKKHLGVNKVKCWAARGRVPHAAEITSMLVELTIQHKQYSPREYSYLLSMTLIRFVNGIVDSGQKGSVACSAIKIAEQANLPAWIVELRHSATHDQIPCLQMLINAQQQALEWLQQNYWEVQGGVAKSTVDLLRNCLYEYVLLRSSNSAIMDERQDGNLLKALRKIAGKLNDDDYAQVLFPLLSSICVDFDPNVELFQLWLPLIQYFDRKWPNFASKFVIGIVEFQNADFTENQVIGARNLELAKALTDYVANRWSTSELDEAILQCLESKNQE